MSPSFVRVLAFVVVLGLGHAADWSEHAVAQGRGGGGVAADPVKWDPPGEPSMKAIGDYVQSMYIDLDEHAALLGWEPIAGEVAACRAKDDGDAAACLVDLAPSSETWGALLVLDAIGLYGRAGEAAKAQVTRVVFLKHYSDHVLAPAILVIIADDFATHDVTKKAVEYYELSLTLFPDGRFAEYARKQCQPLGGCQDGAERESQ